MQQRRTACTCAQHRKTHSDNDIVCSKAALIPLRTVPDHDFLQEYRSTLASTAMRFLVPHRFVASESWTKATVGSGARYIGLFREHEPDLPAILMHKRVLILGEPGAGKSTTGRAIIQHVLNNGPATDVPVLAPLKSYNGNLRNLLTQDAPATVLDAPSVARTYVLDGIDEVPAIHRDALRRELNDLLTTETTAKVVLTSRQAFHVQHPEAFPDGLTIYHLLDFDDNDIRAYAAHRGVDADSFLIAVRDVDCEEEICNPFVLSVMLERFQ